MTDVFGFIEPFSACFALKFAESADIILKHVFKKIKCGYQMQT
jgi:hypothetical protein